MYKNMCEILNNETVGKAKLVKYNISENDLYAKLHGINTGEHVRLSVNGTLMMSDTNMEKRTNTEFVCSAHGNVLIGGLGIGLIILAIQDKEEVTGITIVEKSADVIEIMQKQLPLNDKVKIVCADVFEYEPTEKFNTIYMDIWAYINEDVYEEEMKPLIKRYRKYMITKKEDENRWINCWCKYEAKHGMRI